jgi:hypothetical protein
VSAELKPCWRCEGMGVVHTGVDEAPTTLCNTCEGTGEVAATAGASQASAQGSELEALRAALRSVNAVAIERGDKYGACDQVDNDGQPYQSQWFADLLQKSATPAAQDGGQGQAERERIGGLMANVMFNLAQRIGQHLTSDDCATMDKLRKQWDAARSAPRPVLTDDDLRAFAERHDPHLYGVRLGDLRCLIEDAQTIERAVREGGGK